MRWLALSLAAMLLLVPAQTHGADEGPAPEAWRRHADPSERCSFELPGTWIVEVRNRAIAGP